MEDTLRSADGLLLHRRHWPAAAPRGSVLIVHGLGEHIGRYAALAEALNAAGWSVSGYDQRGHGRSGGPRGGIPHADALLEDLALVLDAQRAEGAAAPLVLLGHSLGGAIAARFVAERLAARPARWARDVDALVLSSPALALAMGPPQRLLLALASRLAPGLALANGLDPAAISRDPAVVRDYLADALVHDRITPRLARFLVDAGAAARAAAPRWRVPTLLLWAGADRCVAPSGSAAFAAAAPPAVLQAQGWPQLAHEVFNEPERDAVLARLLQWLATLPASLAVGAEA